MNKSLNVRLTLVARQKLAEASRNPAGAGAMIQASKQTEKSYRPSLPTSPQMLGWLRRRLGC